MSMMQDQALLAQMMQMQQQGQGQSQPQMPQPVAPNPAQMTSPLLSGSNAAMQSIQESLRMRPEQNKRSIGMGLMHLGRAMGNPQNWGEGKGGALSAVNAGMLPAVESYNQQRMQEEQSNAFALQQAMAVQKMQEEQRRHEQDERHRAAELGETRRYHDLMGGKSGGRSGNPYYGMPALAKHMKIQEEIDAGFLPGSNREVQLTPEQQEQYSNQNQLAMQKVTSDSQTRESALQANNLVQTIDSSDIDSLVRYSGPKGAAQYAIEIARDLAGNPSEDFLKHKEAETAADLEAKEVRQFFKDSITPSVQDALKTLTNPSSPFISPQTAKRKAEKARTIIKKQLQTRQSALKSKAPYEKSPEHKNTFTPEQYDFASAIRAEKPDATKDMNDEDIIKWGISRGEL